MAFQISNMSGNFSNGELTQVSIAGYDTKTNNYLNMCLKDEDAREIGMIIQKSLRRQAKEAAESFKDALLTITCVNLLEG